MTCSIFIGNVETKVSGLSEAVSKAVTNYEISHNGKEITLTISETPGGEADRLIRKIGKRHRDPFVLDVRVRADNGEGHTKRFTGLKLSRHRFDSGYDGPKHRIDVNYKTYQILDTEGEPIPDTRP